MQNKLNFFLLFIAISLFSAESFAKDCFINQPQYLCLNYWAEYSSGGTSEATPVGSKYFPTDYYFQVEGGATVKHTFKFYNSGKSDGAADHKLSIAPKDQSLVSIVSQPTFDVPYLESKNAIIEYTAPLTLGQHSITIHILDDSDTRVSSETGLTSQIEVTSLPTPTPSNDPPSITISNPAGDISTEEETIDISGSANLEVVQVTWKNSRGGGGNATAMTMIDGTISWSQNNIALQEGENVITVTGYDAADLSSSASLTVTRNTEEIINRETFISTLVLALEGAGKTLTPVTTSYFDDIASSAVRNEIMKAESLDIIAESPDKKFNPVRAITRIEALAFTVRTYEHYLGKIWHPSEPAFMDVPNDSTDWQYAPMQKGFTEKLTSGYNAPSDICNKAEVNFSSPKRCFIPSKQVKKNESVAFVDRLILQLKPKVGRAELKQTSGISILTDPRGITAPSSPISLAWAHIMYPADSKDKNKVTDVGKPDDGYPVVIFLHGQHPTCDNDGDGSGLSGNYKSTCSDANRIPNHKGYNYLLERLANHGIVAISINGNEVNNLGHDKWNYWARGKLILSFLDKLKDWNDTLSIDKVGKRFFKKLDMKKIGLSGHSRGGEGVVAAVQLNGGKYSIKAVNAIAPTDQNRNVVYANLMKDAPYFLLVGARDGDVASMHGFRTYDRFLRDHTSLTGTGSYPKMAAFVYGANHNYFNTIWSETKALKDAYSTEDLGLGFDSSGTPKKVNNWAGSGDDGKIIKGGLTVSDEMLAEEQRQIALRTIVAFFRWHLNDENWLKDIFTGSYKHDKVHWTYQDAARLAVDNFEQEPEDEAKNSLGEKNTFVKSTPGSKPGSTPSEVAEPFKEHLLSRSGSNYPTTRSLPSIYREFPHDTLAVKLDWSGLSTSSSSVIYTAQMPTTDVSNFSHLNFRIAHPTMTGTIPSDGLEVTLTSKTTLTTGSVDTKSSSVETKNFSRIPFPYERSGGGCTDCTNQPLLTGIRLPLKEFSVDLKNVVEIKITTTADKGEIVIDDLEFGK